MTAVGGPSSGGDSVTAETADQSKVMNRRDEIALTVQDYVLNIERRRHLRTIVPTGATGDVRSWF